MAHVDTTSFSWTTADNIKLASMNGLMTAGKTTAFFSLLLLLGFASAVQSFSVGKTIQMRRSGGWGSQSSSSTTRLHFQRTLAADYVINVDESSWSAYRINDVMTNEAPEGEKAVTSLQVSLSDVDPHFTLVGSIQDDTAQVTLRPENAEVDPDLIAILSRIIVQSVACKTDSTPSSVQLPNEEFKIDVEEVLTERGVLKMFEPLLGSIENIEISEMVNEKGEPLGMVPRNLVHKANLLHRGIGMVVAKDQPILTPGCATFPELYVHRRTDTKRIFPSLYDMFVGGVSTAREDSKMTAEREVAEELGLERALTDPTMLSGPLFDCTICTSYNRCVVTVFCCTFQSNQDSVTWQEEEVAWGDFVTYDTIVASADLSIQRLVEKSEWPGRLPTRIKERLTESQRGGDNDAWKSWDYVPDGLLVWEAWLNWQKEGQRG